jgi:phosphoribosylglycinamide formyltransferase-1
MLNIAVLISGSGTNLQALIDAEMAGALSSGRIALVVSDHEDAFGLARAQKSHIPTGVVDRRAYPEIEKFDRQIQRMLQEHHIQIVVLAGFLSILGPELVKEYDHRIINVHPSLIPSFCGLGLYGLKVHQSVLDKGVKVTGATVHYVNEIPDGGDIILQKAVDVLTGDTPEILQRRVMEQAEWLLLPAAVEAVCRDWTTKGLTCDETI